MLRVIFLSFYASPPPPPCFPCKLRGAEARRNTSRRALSSLPVTWPEPPHTPQPQGTRLSPLARGCSKPLSPAPQPGPGHPRARRRLPAIVPGAAGCSPRRRQRRPGRAGWERDPHSPPRPPHHHHRHGRLSPRERRAGRR